MKAFRPGTVCKNDFMGVTQQMNIVDTQHGCAFHPFAIDQMTHGNKRFAVTTRQWRDIDPDKEPVVGTDNHAAFGIAGTKGILVDQDWLKRFFLTYFFMGEISTSDPVDPAQTIVAGDDFVALRQPFNGAKSAIRCDKRSGREAR